MSFWISCRLGCAGMLVLSLRLEPLAHRWNVVSLVLLGYFLGINPLSANLTKCSKTFKQLVGKLQTNCLSVFDHFVGLALKGLILKMIV